MIFEPACWDWPYDPADARTNLSDVLGSGAEEMTEEDLRLIVLDWFHKDRCALCGTNTPALLEDNDDDGVARGLVCEDCLAEIGEQGTERSQAYLNRPPSAILAGDAVDTVESPMEIDLTESGGIVERPIRQELIEQAQEHIDARYSPETIRAYTSAFRAFVQWCDDEGRIPLPASTETLLAHLTDIASMVTEDGEWYYSPSTLHMRRAAVDHFSEESGYPRPSKLSKDIDNFFAGFLRNRAHSPKPKGRAITLTMLEEMVASSYQLGAEKPVMALRDRAVLLVGFTGAYRRSEIAFLDIDDIEFDDDDRGMRIRLRRSKGDRAAEGIVKWFPVAADRRMCAVATTREWLAVPRPVRLDPLFLNVTKADRPGKNRLTGGTVNEIVKKYARRIGRDPDLYSAHSLRSGFATSASRKGADLRAIASQTGHRSLEMANRYVQEARGYDNSAVNFLEL